LRYPHLMMVAHCFEDQQLCCIGHWHVCWSKVLGLVLVIRWPCTAAIAHHKLTWGADDGYISYYQQQQMAPSAVTACSVLNCFSVCCIITMTSTAVQFAACRHPTGHSRQQLNRTSTLAKHQLPCQLTMAGIYVSAAAAHVFAIHTTKLSPMCLNQGGASQAKQAGPVVLFHMPVPNWQHVTALPCLPRDIL